MADLFAIEATLERIEVPDAEIYYQRALPLRQSPDEMLQRLIAEIPWRSEAIQLWGKRYVQPRLLAWFGDADARYTYSGVTHEPLPWTDLLLELRDVAQDLAGVAFNSVLANYYRDERDSMGLHTDAEPELGPEPVIASLSFGATRAFVLKHKHRKDLKSVRIELASGSLLMMRGATQMHWRHGINKQARPCGPRVNLTFRRIIPATEPI